MGTDEQGWAEQGGCRPTRPAMRSADSPARFMSGRAAEPRAFASIVSKSFQYVGWVLLVVAGVCWFLVPLRLVACLVLVIGLFSLLIPPLRRRRRYLVGVWVLFFAVTWLPFDVTTKNVPGPPRFVRCCGGVPYDDLEEVARRWDAGECQLCSDLVTGFEPTWYLLW